MKWSFQGLPVPRIAIQKVSSVMISNPLYEISCYFSFTLLEAFRILSTQCSKISCLCVFCGCQAEKAVAPTPVLLPGKSHGWRSLVGCSPVGHDWATSLSLFTFLHWRRKWQCTPVFLPGESQGRGSLVGCRLWGHTESDTTEVTWRRQQWMSRLLFKSIILSPKGPSLMETNILQLWEICKMYLC